MNYLIVGAGLFGAVFAHEAAKSGNQVTVIEKRDHIAGNIYTKEMELIFSTLLIKKFGIMFINFQVLTVILIALLQITKDICITCRSI